MLVLIWSLVLVYSRVTGGSALQFFPTQSKQVKGQVCRTINQCLAGHASRLFWHLWGGGLQSLFARKVQFLLWKEGNQAQGTKLMVVYYILSLDGTNVIRSAWMSTKKELSCQIYCQKCIQISDPLRTSKTCVCQRESDLAFFSVDSVAPSSTECTQHLIGSCQEITLTKNPNHKHFSVTSHTLPFYSKKQNHKWHAPTLAAS